MTEKINPKDLVRRIDFPVYLRNELEVEVQTASGRGKEVYVGEANNLQLEDKDNIVGQARLTKYWREEGTKRVIRPVWWFPLVWKIRENVPYSKDTRCWTLGSEKDDEKYFVYNGESCLGYGDDDTEYRTALITVAANRKIKLMPKLFDLVFGPIDKKLIEVLKELRSEK